jgi:hypothetical protein
MLLLYYVLLLHAFETIYNVPRKFLSATVVVSQDLEGQSFVYVASNRTTTPLGSIPFVENKTTSGPADLLFETFLDG